MGVAVAAMHYIGMGAASFICTTSDRLFLPHDFGVVGSAELAVLTIGMSIGLAIIIALDQVYQRLLKLT